MGNQFDKTMGKHFDSYQELLGKGDKNGKE